MRANPKPDQMLSHIESQGPVIEPDPCRVHVSANFLELKRRVTRIVFEQLEVLVRQPLPRFWETSVMKPKSGWALCFTAQYSDRLRNPPELVGAAHRIFPPPHQQQFWHPTALNHVQPPSDAVPEIRAEAGFRWLSRFQAAYSSWKRWLKTPCGQCAKRKCPGLTFRSPYAAKLSPQEHVTTALGFFTLKPPC